MRTAFVPMLALVAVASLSVPGVLWAQAPKVIDRVVAVVEQQVITLSEVEERTEQALQMLPPAVREEQRAEVFKQVLDMMVDEALIEHQRLMNPDELTVTDTEVDRAVDDVAQQYRVTREELAEAVERQGSDWTTYRENLRRQLLRVKVVSKFLRTRVQVSDLEVKRAYEEQIALWRANARVRVRHVLFLVPADAPEAQVEAARGKAKAAQKDLLAGEDFEAVARRVSEDPTAASNGGDLGFQRPASLLPALRRVVEKLEVGARSGIIRSRIGWHIIEFAEREEAEVKPLAEVEPQLRNRLYQEAVEREFRLWLDEVRRTSFVELKL